MSKTIIEREFWNDEQIIDEYSPEDKLFMMYLLTCPRGNALGIFKLPIKLIAFEIGYSPEAVRTLIDRFMNKYERINYDYENQEIAIYRALKYTVSKGGKPVEDMMRQLLEEVTITENIIKVYNVMIPWWLKSNRIVDKKIKTLIEDEIEKRKNISNVNVNVNDNVYVNVHSYNVSGDDSSEDEEIKAYQPFDDRGDDSYYDTSGDTWVKSIKNAWNKLDENIPRLQVINPNSERYRLTKTAVNDYGVGKVVDVIQSINDSEFLKGYVNEWKIYFDWFIKPNNFIKVMEGNYIDKKVSQEIPQSKEMSIAEKARMKRLERLGDKNEKL